MTHEQRIKAAAKDIVFRHADECDCKVCRNKISAVAAIIAAHFPAPDPAAEVKQPPVVDVAAVLAVAYELDKSAFVVGRKFAATLRAAVKGKP